LFVGGKKADIPLKESIHIAILDLYNGAPNEGMRCIREIVEKFGVESQVPTRYSVFDVRGKEEMPDVGYDAYISSGGPGDPSESAGSSWENRYFRLMEAIKAHNHEYVDNRKHVLLICHSFQLFCRHYEYGEVSKRRSTSFGVMPGHKTPEGHTDPLLESLDDPFWIVDSREYQITQPDESRILREGGSILCLEKIRPHVDLERAVMAIRFDEAFFGTQFHPEADAGGMRMYLLRKDKKEDVIGKYGEEKYLQMLDYLDDPEKIMLTHDTIVPRFLNRALKHRIPAISQ